MSMTYPTPLIPHGSDNFGVLQETFRWQIPEYFNIAEAVCDRHQAHRDRIALYWEDASGQAAEYTFGDLIELSNQFAKCLRVCLSAMISKQFANVLRVLLAAMISKQFANILRSFCEFVCPQ